MDFDVVRPREFLLARFSFKGYRLEEPASDRRILVPDGSERPLIIVSLPPQSIAEQAFVVTGSRLPDLTPRSAAAGWTRLAFAPVDRAISFALGPVLKACANAPLATGPPFVDREHLYRPGPSETAIEFPYGVLLAAGDSQHRFSALAAAAAPDAATAELWNLVLTRAGDGETTAEIRWIFGEDERQHDFALTSGDRDKLRQSVFSVGPQVAKIEKLWLSSLGGTGSLVADFREGATLETWRHRAMLGRDAYVKVVTRGFLYPLGHRAVAVEIVQRELFANNDPSYPWWRKAFLRRIRYIVLRQRTVVASQLDLPFTSMTIEQETTPELTDEGGSSSPPSAFLIQVDNRPFPFSISALDRSGRLVTLSMPLVFMELTASLSNAEKAYKGFEVVSGRGQPIAYVPKNADDERQGLETVALTFATRSPVTPAGALDPPFSSRISRMLARVPEMQAMTAGASETMIEYAPEYLNGGKDGFDGKKNPAAVFARFIPGSELPFGLGAGRQVGLARPDMVLGGLSRDTGIVAGDTGALTAALTARDVAKEMGEYCKKGLAEATLLGGVRLVDLLALGGDAKDDLPKTVVKPIFEAAGSAPVGFEATLTWTPRVRKHLVLTFLPGGGDRPLSIKSVSLTRAGKTPDTKSTTTAELKKPMVNFLGVASVEFALLRFSTRSGAKPELTVEQVELTFQPPLSFVADLARCLPGQGFSDPPALAVDTSGARLGYSVGLPTVGVGVFSLQNIAVSAALRIPFDGSPMRLSFAFCRRDEPFLLTVSLFGGGGFLGLEFGVDRITLLEASIEFGGAFALNLGVASGGVFVMAGFYFKLATVAGAPDTEQTELTGYFRCGGSVEVLCIISISVEFYLALTYKNQGTQTVLRGVARLTVTVEIAFFSKDVTLEVERTFAGSAGDPTFGDLMGSADWDRYCNAFAVEGA